MGLRQVFILLMAFILVLPCEADGRRKKIREKKKSRYSGIPRPETDGNFFRRNNNFSWDISKHEYSGIYYKVGYDSHSLSKILRLTVGQGLPSRYAIWDLYKSDLNQHVAIGDVLPRLSLTFGDGIEPINIKNAFSGLFQFLLPHNWFSLINARKRYKAERYLFLQKVLDDHLNSRELYIQLHQQLRIYEIRSFYHYHLRQFNHYIGSQDHSQMSLEETKAITELISMQAEMRSDIAGELAQLRVMTNMLGRQIVYKKNDWNQLRIESIKNFPKKVPSFNKSTQIFVDECLESSLEIRSMIEFSKIAKNSKFITLSSEVLTENSGGGIGARGEFSANFGYGTLPKYFITKTDEKIARLDVIQNINTVKSLSNAVIALHKFSYQQYKQSEIFRRRAKRSFANYLTEYLDLKEGQRILYHGLLDSLERTMKAEFLHNESLHNYLIAQARKERLLVIPVLSSGIIKWLPDLVEGRKIKKWLRFKSKDYKMSYSNREKEVSKILSLKDFKNYIENLELQEGRKGVELVLTDHFSLILGKKYSMRFYEYLSELVIKYNLAITVYEERKLKKRRTKIDLLSIVRRKIKKKV